MHRQSIVRAGAARWGYSQCLGCAWQGQVTHDVGPRTAGKRETSSDPARDPEPATSVCPYLGNRPGMSQSTRPGFEKLKANVSRL